MQPFITVLMPTYNRAHSIRTAIQSILDQTYKKFELLIVDDGSTDDTRKIVYEYMGIDRRIHYKFITHAGLVTALTLGNNRARGKIIVKQDSDDISMPDRLEVIVKNMGNNELFYHGMYQVWEQENMQGYRLAFIPALPVDKKRILKEQYIPGAFAYTKQFIDKHPYRDLYCSEDWMLILDAVLSDCKIGFINQGLYQYFLLTDSNSMIHENTGHYEDDEAKMQKWLKEDYGIKRFKYATRT